MTLSQAHTAFMIELDKRPISAAPSFLSDEIDYFINKAYITLINRKFTGHNVLQQPFETSPKRTSDLQALVKSKVITTFNIDNHAINEFRFELGPDVLIPVDSIIRWSMEAYTPTTEINHSVVDKFRVSTLNNPWIPSPGIVYEDGNACVFVDQLMLPQIAPGFPRLDLTHICKPHTMKYPIDANLEFEVSWVDEIISQAVDFALDNIESQRVQTHSTITANTAE